MRCFATRLKNSFITSNQDQNHGPGGLSKTRDVPEFQVTNRLIYNHWKSRKPRRHNVATMVNEPYLHSADDGPIARNWSAIWLKCLKPSWWCQLWFFHISLISCYHLRSTTMCCLTQSSHYDHPMISQWPFRDHSVTNYEFCNHDACLKWLLGNLLEHLHLQLRHRASINFLFFYISPLPKVVIFF